MKGSSLAVGNEGVEREEEINEGSRFICNVFGGIRKLEPLKKMFPRVIYCCSNYYFSGLFAL